MRKMRWKIILMLVVISLASSLLSNLLTIPLVPELPDNADPLMNDLIRRALESSITLVIFTLFIILGVQEITAPILRLSKAAQQIADGDFAVVIPPSRRKDEVGQLERSFAIMAKELGSTQIIQKDFISNVSHEYKTPLAVISGYAELLASPSLGQAERAEYSAYITQETERLSRMTSNILLLSKVENQSIRPPMAAFSLDELLRQAALHYLNICSRKDIAMDIEIPSISMTGNEELLLHVFTNLLDNACKYTDAGGTIRIGARQTGDSAVVTIDDDGIGMETETAAHIFDQFYQADTSRSSSGAGLGLSLARRIVQLHRGQIDVTSAAGQGATFTVTLPLHPDTKPSKSR